MPSDESKLLPHLKELVALAKDVERQFLTECSKESKGKQKKSNFFVYHFLHRTISYCESFALLVENEFYHEAILVARTVLEGLIYFEHYRSEHHDLADKWGFFVFYEDFASTVNYIQHFTIRKWRQDSVGEYGAALMERFEEEFGFNFPVETLRWYRGSSLPDLINKIKDKKLRRQIRDYYDVVYGEFSQIIHWSPSGVIGGNVNILIALTAALDALFEMSREADKKYKLGFDERIRRLRADVEKTSSDIVPAPYPQAASIPKQYLQWMHR